MTILEKIKRWWSKPPSTAFWVVMFVVFAVTNITIQVLVFRSLS